MVRVRTGVWLYTIKSVTQYCLHNKECNTIKCNLVLLFYRTKCFCSNTVVITVIIVNSAQK